MDIKDAKKAMMQAENEIVSILKGLERDTGLEVKSVCFERSRMVRGFSLPEIENVKIELQI